MLDHFAEAFTTCGTVAGYELRIRKDRPRPQFVECARWVEQDGSRQSASLEFSPSPGRRIAGMEVFDLLRGTSIANSRPTGTGGALTVTDAESGEQLLPAIQGGGEIDLSASRRLVLTFDRMPTIPADGRLVVRLRDPKGHTFASVPFLEERDVSDRGKAARTEGGLKAPPVRPRGTVAPAPDPG
ncbi:MAG: hypothetical protein WKF75_03250 [Singulisphaera sp.]